MTSEAGVVAAASVDDGRAWLARSCRSADEVWLVLHHHDHGTPLCAITRPSRLCGRSRSSVGVPRTGGERSRRLASSAMSQERGPRRLPVDPCWPELGPPVTAACGPRGHPRASRSRSRPGRQTRSRRAPIAGAVPGRRLGGAVGVALGRGDGQRRRRIAPTRGWREPGLAYRITCSLADAEDVVQEAWIRWAARNAATVDNPAAWLTTVTSRLALDRLRAQRRRREVYVGLWLPDPVLTPRTPRKRRAAPAADVLRARGRRSQDPEPPPP
jgi:Sigma-70 region 2